MAFVPFEDLDSFLEFEQSFHNPASPLGFGGTIDPSQMMLGNEQTEDRKPFAPSFEYDTHRQLTGLPNGAVSNFAAMSQMGQSTFGPAMAGPSSQFNFTPDLNNFEMDFDLSRQDPMPAYFFPTNTIETTNFNDPMIMAGPSMTMPQIPQDNQRLWPGMHSQQAQQAKAAAIAQQQRNQQMGQQIMQHRQQQSMQGQTRVLPTRPSPQQAAPTPNDPAVDDRISRLLDQMRHNSIASMDDENDNGESSRNARIKKDEEDMDDDERMLVSEEGKKLSSKERRQLRNKVSARAFRSRRKEYIGQLESELATKATECNDLKARNRNLQDQNQQLTRLTQTLLRHPAFSSFLNDMSSDPSILDLPLGTSKTEAYSQRTKKEPVSEPMHETRINMAMMPQTGLDLSMLSLGSSSWNVGSSLNFGFQQPQVFSVLELPRGPLLDDHFGLTKLSGKSSGVGKAAAPKIELPSFAAADAVMTKQEVRDFDAEGVEEDPSFALYVNASPAVSSTSILSPMELPTATLCNKSSTIALIVRPCPATDAAAIVQVNALFDNLGSTYRSIEALTAHLPY